MKILQVDRGSEVAWFYLLLCSLFCAWILGKLNALQQINTLNALVMRVAKVIRSPRISDHWKERILPCYSFRMFKQSLLLLVILLAAFFPFILCAVLSFFSTGQFLSIASSLSGILVSSGTAICFSLFLFSEPDGDYGFWSKVLHYIVLGSPVVGEALFDIEKSVGGPKRGNVSGEQHVFVAGLARAGTTILMRKLYADGNFCSLSYRDMPFVLAPRLWGRVSGVSQRRAEKKERAHGDGLQVDYDSPEALEEVFWRTFCGSDYIKKDCLLPMEAGSEIVEKFRTFVGIVLKGEPKKCYLSKNNNNILRLSSLCQAFPEALIIVPFRDPLQQAYSLMKQHRRFVVKHGEDSFSRKYMTWLAHHEFGADHRPFRFTESGYGEETPDQLNYWLRVWIDCYSYVIENAPFQVVFLSYENLCDDTEYVWDKLSARSGGIGSGDAVQLTKSMSRITEPISGDLMYEATEIYGKLLEKSIGYRVLGW